VHVSVVENAAARSDFKGPLLLLFSTLNKILMAHDLNPEEPACDRTSPQ